MRINMRNLNQNEKFPCNISDVKKVFRSDDEISVSFGFLSRNHTFDSKHFKRPDIKGTIISSFSINRRLNVFESIPILSFYVIRDDRYDEKSKAFFVETILPKLNNWYCSTLSKSEVSIPGVEELLVEWTGRDFIEHTVRYS